MRQVKYFNRKKNAVENYVLLAPKVGPTIDRI